MHFGLMLECDYREGATEKDAFEEVFSVVEAAEAYGLDGVWLAERHFSPAKSDSGDQGGPLPSIVSAPLIIASAIAARTERLRIGMAVSVLPLNHPVRMAEEAATLDNISRGRFDFGVGRSGLTRSYEGYSIPYSESKERFQECLEVIVKAWTNERFSYQGQYYDFNDVTVTPRPYQKPHPPIRIAAASEETFPQVARMGYPIFVGLRAADLKDMVGSVRRYREAWRESGHPGDGDVMLRVPIYVADTVERARSDPETSTMLAHRWISERLLQPMAGMSEAASAARAERGRQMAAQTYDDLRVNRMAYGTSEYVVDRIKEFDDRLNLSGVLAEMNVGGMVPHDRVLNSIRLFGERVVAKFR